MKKLVAFYSRAGENYFGGTMRYIAEGNTEKVAKMIADATGADLFHIEQKVPYAEDYNTCIAQAKQDLRSEARPELTGLPDSIDEYAEVYLGYPIYWGDLPMAVYTFLENFDWNGKTIHPFCTHEGSGLGRTPEKIGKACRGASVTKGLAVEGGSADGAGGAVRRWV